MNGLPTWDLEGLLVGISIRPSGYADIAGLGQWLEASTSRLDVPKVIGLLESMAPPVRQRAAYLLWASEDISGAEAVVAAYPPMHTARLGPREAGGRYEPLTKVSDTLLSDYLSVGTGS